MIDMKTVETLVSGANKRNKTLLYTDDREKTIRTNTYARGAVYSNFARQSKRSVAYGEKGLCVARWLNTATMQSFFRLFAGEGYYGMTYLLVIKTKTANIQQKDVSRFKVI